MTKCTHRTVAPAGDGKHVRYDRGEAEPPSVAVATALATYYDEDVVDGSVQLYQYIDPDALDSIFAETYTGTDRADGEIRFEVEDALVVVRSDRVHVYEM